MPVVKASASAVHSGKDSLQAVTSQIGKGTQELRDIPQSLTVVTERLIDDRNLDTLKEALHNTAGISFLAAEGGEEDIRLRGFSLQATGDIFRRRPARPGLLRARQLQLATGWKCCAARPACCSAAAPPAAPSTRSARGRCCSAATK